MPDVQGRVYRASRGAYHLSVESAGEHRAVILIEGDYRNPVGRFMNYTLRLHFTAGGTQALLSHTVRNREDGREGRDLSRLWLEGSLEVDDDTIRRVMHVHRTVNTVQAMIDIPENVELETRDDLTTIRNVASLREDPDDRCYSIVHELDVNRHGGCAPMLDLHEPGAGGMLIRFAMPEPEREAPMRLASEGNGFEVDFYPAFAEPMHLGEGMGKTRDLVLHFHDDALPAMDVVHQADVLTYPGVQSVSAAMYRDAQLGDIQHALPRQPNKYMMLEQKIDTLLAAQWAYDWPVATGWRDFGDEIGSRGRCPEFGITQYINNEEDYLYCLMIEGWRRGVGLMPQARKVARHLMDIDFIDHSTDPARDGATCPHSTNHTDGEVYPSHQWCQGLLYYYLTTGDPQALRVSRRIGDNLIWWITGPRRDSLTYSGRESAWPLLALAALYDVTRDAKYRDAGMIIIDSFKQAMREHGRLQWEYPPGSGIWSGYMHLMTFNGIWDMYAVTGDASILELWKQASKPVVDALEDPHSFGYLHFRNWPIKWADLNTLMRWYHLTGDEKYVRLGRNGLRLVLAGAPQPLNQTQGFIAMGYRHFIFFMSLADEHGMIDDNACTLVW